MTRPTRTRAKRHCLRARPGADVPVARARALVGRARRRRNARERGAAAGVGSANSATGGACGDGSCAGTVRGVARRDAAARLRAPGRAAAGAAGLGDRRSATSGTRDPAARPASHSPTVDVRAAASGPGTPRTAPGEAGSAETTRVARRFSIGGRPGGGEKRLEGYSTLRAAARRPPSGQADPAAAARSPTDRGVFSDRHAQSKRPGSSTGRATD